MIRTQRIWEVDMLRGIAIILMVFFHFVWDLNYFGFTQIEFSQRFWFWFGRGIGSLFLFLVGVSLVLSFMRRSKEGRQAPFRHYFRRGLWIFLMGMLITLGTRIFIGESYIVFGILHFIGVSVVLAYPFLFLKTANLILGILILAVGQMVRAVILPYPWLLWLGFRPENFSSVDYYPLLPWFGVILLGIFAGKVLYSKGRMLRLPDYSGIYLVQIFCTLGKRSLFIYFIHQPILFGIFLLLSL